MKREDIMLCKKCGQFIPDGVYYCRHCGEAVNQSYTQQPFNSNNQNTQNSNQQYNPYAQQYNPKAYEYMISSKIEEVRTLGILAIILGLFFPILGIVLGCIGLSKLNEIPLSNQYRYETELSKKRTKTLCVIGIVLPVILWLLAIITIILLSSIMLSAMY